MTLPDLIPTADRRPARSQHRCRFASALIASVFGAAGCRSAPAEDQRAPVAEPPAPAAWVAEASAPAAAPPRGPSASVTVAGKSFAVTEADARVLQALLRARIEQSQLALRDYLLQAAQGAVDVQPTSVSVGRWTLRDFNGQLCLYHRGPTTAVFHAARVAGSTGSWTVQEPTEGEILMRPRP